MAGIICGVTPFFSMQLFFWCHNVKLKHKLLIVGKPQYPVYDFMCNVDEKEASVGIQFTTDKLLNKRQK